MNVFLTGGTGFLGNHLRRTMGELGWQATAPSHRDCDLCQVDSLRQFDGETYDRIVHLAAWTQAGDFCLSHPGEQWVINQRINTNVVSWWQEQQPQAKFICMGTSCAYDPALPLSEENYLLGRPIDSLFTYAMTKRMLYAGLLAMARQYDLRYLCAVPSTLYGGGYHTDGRQMHFIFDLIRKIIRGKEKGEDVVLWGDGSQCREVVHVGDFCRLLLALDEVTENDLVNIGAGEEFSIRFFAETISELVGYDPGDIIYDTSRYVGAKSKCLAVDHARSLLPDYRLAPLREGLRETIDWFYEEVPELLS